MSVLLWVGIIIVVFVLLYFGVGAFAAVTLTRVSDHPQYENDPGTYGLDFKKVTFTSRKDHLKLAAWYIPNENAQKAMILVHGRNASKQNAISGEFPKLGATLHQEGYGVLMIDLRSHGESEGKRYTWGAFERYDVLSGVDFLMEKGFLAGNIGVLGISLGGAAAIGAAAEDDAIGALVVDSTFYDLIELVEPNWVVESGLPMFFVTGVYWMWRIFYGFDLREVRPVDEIAQIMGRPILIMHCKEDEIVEVSPATHLKEAAPHADLVIFEDCSHAELFRDHPKVYLNALITFLKNRWS